MSSTSVEGGAAPVPLVDLQAAHAEIADDVRAGFERVLESGAFILGPDVAAFEQEYARFSGAGSCVAISNGTDALELVLRARDIGAGDEVIVPVNTFIATAASVTRAGAKPVFVDCDPEYLLIDPASIEASLTERTRAIVPVHLYGQVAPMDAVHEIARERGLFVVEDNAQAQGARQDGRQSGAFGLASVTSFYPGKNIGAYGDAGAVVTDDADIARTLRALRNYGAERKYEHTIVGFNCRLDSLQAVVLRAKLKHLDRWNEQRRQAAARYAELLHDIDGLRPVACRDGNEHVYYLYVVRVPGGPQVRAAVFDELHAKAIGVGIHYPTPVHLTGAYAGHRQGPGSFPVAEEAAGCILSLPIFPQITPDQQQRVAQELRQALSS